MVWSLQTIALTCFIVYEMLFILWSNFVVEVEAFKSAQSGNISSKFSVSQILQKAEEYIESFQLEMAFKFCEKAAAMEPSNVKALELLGSLNLQLGKPVEAYEVYLTYLFVYFRRFNVIQFI